MIVVDGVWHSDKSCLSHPIHCCVTFFLPFNFTDIASFFTVRPLDQQI